MPPLHTTFRDRLVAPILLTSDNHDDVAVPTYLTPIQSRPICSHNEKATYPRKYSVTVNLQAYSDVRCRKAWSSPVGVIRAVLVLSGLPRVRSKKSSASRSSVHGFASVSTVE